MASAPSRATAARALVDCAVRSWRLKFPTSKSDDCAVVCLFLDTKSSANQTLQTEPKKTSVESVEIMIADSSNIVDLNQEETPGPISIEAHVKSSTLQHSYTLHDYDEIVPVNEEGTKVEKMPGRSQSPRRLADCISTAEEEEWSALEGVTRVNSLLNLPRFLSGDKRSTSWRKWL